MKIGEYEYNAIQIGMGVKVLDALFREMLMNGAIAEDDYVSWMRLSENAMGIAETIWLEERSKESEEEPNGNA